MSIIKVWKKWNLQRWRPQTFTFSTDPQLDAKVHDVLGLYLNPLDKAVVICVDDKTQIQALDRTAPIEPLRPALPEKQTHDDKRNGTTSLFAALEIATGKVTDRCYDQHTNTEFPDFLELVARISPASSRTSSATTTPPTSTRTWRRGWPRAPASSCTSPRPGSWLNIIEIFFGIITKQGIRRGTFEPVRDLKERHPQQHRRLEQPLPTVNLDQKR